MDSCAGLQKYQAIITCSYVMSNARDRRPTSAAKSARRRQCGWLALNVFTLWKIYLTTKGIKIGTSIEITNELCNLSYMPTEYSFQTMLWPLHWKEHQPLSRQRVMNGALSRSCGRVEKNFELSTTTTASMTPVLLWTSALNRTTTRSVK